ncbi:MAG: (2Fe-2S)-binding protein [Proteobacteria bacterium]|nr:(2Fe-2S)-binding protein [Pseudomonadota bacterium]
MELSINGQVIEVAADADSPLLWAIRDFTDYTGTKFGCGIGACGACTVLIDGQPVRSCQTLAADVGGAAITTIEGLSEAGDHPVQRAWIEEQVPQCGYCQSGMILAAVALLDGNPVPDDADIDAAITNICRCGTYGRIRRAIHRAAEIMREEG